MSEVTYPARVAQVDGDASRALLGAHEQFLAAPDAPLPDSLVRSVVAQSWRRSLEAGVDPEAPAPLALDADALAAYRATHPLAPLMPLVRDLLAEDADEAGHIVAVGDATGRLLWVEGHHGLRTLAERMHFVAGALWSEDGAGTNAPGTALALNSAVQIRSGEHFGVEAHRWSCVAAPVRDPLTGGLLGVVDLTGGDDVSGPRALALVRACAAAMESQLLVAGRDQARALRPRAAARRPAHVVVQPRAVLSLLGGDVGTLELHESDGAARAVTLSRRHTEIVWLLALAARRGGGLTVQALDAALHESGEHLVTVRAEVARLRRVLGEVGGTEVLASRPYRLAVEVDTDVDVVRRHLARGAVLKALDVFTGPPVPGSAAPGVVAARDELVAEVREAVLRSRSATALERWTALECGHDDAQAWELLDQVLPYGSPRRAAARAHRRRLLA